MATGGKSVPQFSKNQADKEHFNSLRKRVLQKVATLPARRKGQVTLKAIILPLIYFGCYLLALASHSYTQFLFCYMALGAMLVIMFLNLIHEACHGNLFKNKLANSCYVTLFDIIGANSYIWQKRHVRLHHNFTNVMDWDSDIEKSRFLKVHPDDRKKFFVKYQHWLIFVYPMFITNWFLIRDFKDYFSNKTIVRKLGDIPAIEFVKLFFFKAFFIFYLVVIPALLLPYGVGEILFALLVMLLTAGFFALFVLLPPHVNTGNEFPHSDENLHISQSWFLHQLITTNDVNGGNWFTRFVMANFNFHLAHHLFPNISYVYAREVTAEIKAYCLENNLPYKSFPLVSTFINHYKLLRRNGCTLDIMEDDM